MDTQDILADVRDAEESGESENVFFLYVATPRKPPRQLHKKVIEPYLKRKGWTKVSYKSTGFRALYFLRRKNEDGNSDESASFSRNVHESDDCITISSDEEDDIENGPSSAKRSKTSNSINASSFILNATQRATNHRTELKRIIEKYKKDLGLSFHVHIVLSRPLDYEEDFADLENSAEF